MKKQLTDQDRAAILKTGSEIMERQPSAHIQRFKRMAVPGRDRPVDCEVHYLWPGVVRIIDQDTHEVIAESQPGKPFTLAG